MTSPNPTVVSGPGALSRRTDGGQPIRHIANAKYGEDKAFVQQQKMAPLADGPGAVATPPPSAMAPQASAGPGPGGPADGGGAGPMPTRELVGLDAPTSRPNEPVTAGAAMGPGPGPASRPAQPDMKPGQLSQALGQYFAADDTGVLQDFAWKLSEMGL